MAEGKRVAAQWAAELVESHMVVGLGTGSTAIIAVRRIAERLAAGTLREIVAIPTSGATAAEAKALGIALGGLEDHPVIDLTIDGADEVDPQLNLIKGGGGALLREKIVAQATRREVIVVDAAKRSAQLGTRFYLPVEVVDFGWRPEALYLESLGGTATLRLASDGSVMRTDQGNLILDWSCGPIPDPVALSAKLVARAGVVEVGLFCGLATDLVIGTPDGVEHTTA
ncbi:MAG: ribose-5-phosphate isomerase RpiA [Acidimicrobiales bacterium]